MTSLPKPAYVLSEPHLSGHRVVLGYELLTDAQDAHQYLAALGASASPITGRYEPKANETNNPSNREGV